MDVPLLDTIAKAKARILELASKNPIVTSRSSHNEPTYGHEIVDLAYDVGGGGINNNHYKKLLISTCPEDAYKFAKVTTDAFDELIQSGKIIMEDTSNPIHKRLKLNS